MSDNVLDVHRRALSDYRIALGLELRSRRTNAEYSFEKLASHSNVPAETLRSYEKGTSLPQLVRLVTIGNVYGVVGGVQQLIAHGLWLGPRRGQLRPVDPVAGSSVQDRRVVASSTTASHAALMAQM
jgi:transcriptional regulator with XRE-family HTH domain